MLCTPFNFLILSYFVLSYSVLSQDQSPKTQDLSPPPCLRRSSPLYLITCSFREDRSDDDA